MKILITDNGEQIGIIKDFNNMDYALIAQTITELELLKQELLEMYGEIEEEAEEEIH